jgi:natural product precursor
MKKKTKKLTLSKETVRNLAEPEMKDAAGGSNTVCWTELSCGQPRTFCEAHPTEVGAC